MRLSVFTKTFLVDYFLHRYLSEEASRSRGTIVDVGCGSCPYHNYFAPNVTQYVGIDLYTAQHLIPMPADTAYVCARADKLPLRDGAVDTLLCMRMLEDVPDPLVALREFHRILNRDGLLFLSVAQSWRVNDPPYDYYRFTEYGLRHLLTTSGFHVLVHKEEGGMWTLVGARIIYWLNEGVGRRALCGPLIHWLANPVLNILFLFLYKWQSISGDAVAHFVVAQSSVH